jgi:hypothetical protein
VSNEPDKQTCYWRRDGSFESYETACGHCWQFINGGVKDNEVKFCMYCGLPVEESEITDNDLDDYGPELGGDN